MNIETLDFQELINAQNKINAGEELNVEEEKIDEFVQIEKLEDESIEEDTTVQEENVTIEEERTAQEENVIIEEDNNKLLPLGTVVLLKEAKKRLMILGYYPLNETKTNKSHDYIGCIFPEGLLASENIAMFNNDQIDKVYYEGLKDQETLDFQNKLNAFFETL